MENVSAQHGSAQWYPVSLPEPAIDPLIDDTLTIFNALGNTSSATAMYVLRKYLEKIGYTDAPSLSAILPDPCAPLAYDIDKVFGKSIQVLWREKERKVSLIWLHTVFGIHHFLKSPYRYVTFLRDPRLTFVSRALFTGKANDIPSLVKYAEGTDDENCFCHDLARFHCHYGEQTIRLFDHHLEPKPTPEAALTKAKRHIEQYFSFVGIAELFNSSLFLLSRLLGYREITPWVRQCARRGRPELHDLPSHLQKRIETIVQADIELYLFCKARLLEQLSGIDFGESLKNYDQAMMIWDAPASRKYMY